MRMSNRIRVTIAGLVLLCTSFSSGVAAQKGSFAEIKQLQSPQSPRLGIIIHGGAGVLSKAEMTPEKEKQYRAKLQEAVVAGYRALQDGRSSIDAVETAIRILE